MAKKKLDISMEELLEQALVPEGEQPYDVPDNWVWTSLKHLVEINRGVSYNKNEAYKDRSSNSCLVLRGGNIEEGTLNLDNDNVYVDLSIINNNQLLKENDIIIVSSTGSSKVIGRAGISDGNYSNVAFGAFLTMVRPKGNTCKKYVSLFFQTNNYRNAIRGLAKGVNINNIKNEYIENITIPLPPLDEQQRIVDCIESLFEKLDQAKGLIQDALDSFENRKAAILHKAFTGKLTNKWREENGVDFERDWEEKKLGEVCKSIFDGDHMPPPKAENGVPFLVISNINKGVLSFENTRFVPEEYYNNISQTRRPSKGDILYSIVGSYGIPVMVSTNDKFCFQRHIAILKPNKIDNRFLFYIMQSNKVYNKVTDIATGTAQLTVSIKGLREVEIICPPLEEQKEIVRILDSILDNEQKAKELSDVIDKIDHLKKSILVRAFRGELSTNDPNDVNALELLKEVLRKRTEGREVTIC